MGYNPRLWGNEGWYFIHFVALNYPMNPTQDDKEKYTLFFESLKRTLPCEGCAFNWSQKIEKYPPKLENRKALFEWTVDMHNFVNKEHGKRQLNYDEALKKINEKKENEIIKDSFIKSTILFIGLLGFSSLLLKNKFGK
jgi:hypothetical protein